ncbi:3-dehydroquinate synthase [Chloracidobacterium sp. D]|uniref:3-dehydroquinate synthase n=1 Tax=Chloracidobacterium sp. D TaxID=2821536 RepID=UPI001B8B9218|nr:3-dehydroquinate synthase [Chloracidobacterium sp. D]QUV81821.1 3-dehydroquinate synthase [Chloracidobacterium sp. D]
MAEATDRHPPVLRAVTVPVTHAGGQYAIRIETGRYRSLGQTLRQTFGDHPCAVVIVSNPKVARHYAAAVVESVAAAGFHPHLCLIPDGERYKTLRTVAQIWDFCVARQIERRDLLVALGGGVVGDITGFAAATYLRGLAFVQLPTTLLAMIDSAVGGKTGINHRAGKNLIGAFHQPALVVADLETLTTLPRREWNAGWHEAIKYGVIRDADLFARLEARLPLALNQPLPWDWLAAVVADCCRIKAAIVARDERETGERKVLNFGHTVGHALEAVTRYRRFRHGEAVGIGMVAACQIAVRLGKLTPDEAQRLEQLVRRVGRMPGTDGITVAALLEALRHDKKVSQGRLRFILPSRIGWAEEYCGSVEEVLSAVLTDTLARFSRRRPADQPTPKAES